MNQASQQQFNTHHTLQILHRRTRTIRGQAPVARSRRLARLQMQSFGASVAALNSSSTRYQGAYVLAIVTSLTYARSPLSLLPVSALSDRASGRPGSTRRSIATVLNAAARHLVRQKSMVDPWLRQERTVHACHFQKWLASQCRVPRRAAAQDRSRNAARGRG